MEFYLSSTGCTEFSESSRVKEWFLLALYQKIFGHILVNLFLGTGFFITINSFFPGSH